MATKTMDERDVDVSGVTQEEFLKGLNVDLANEYSAVIMYRTYASQVQGQWRMELRAFFEQEIPDELGHAQILADKIVALGGTPTVLPAPVKQATPGGQADAAGTE